MDSFTVGGFEKLIEESPNSQLGMPFLPLCQMGFVFFFRPQNVKMCFSTVTAPGVAPKYGQQPMYQKPSVMWVGSSWLRVPEYHVRMANSVPQAGFLLQLEWVNLVFYSTQEKHHANKQPTDQPTKSNNKQPTKQEQSTKPTKNHQQPPS